MDIEIQEMYSEVYGVLNMLGDSYIKRIPNSLYNMIKDSKSSTYNPKYIKEIRLDEQQIKKESLSMIALFHLNYWCNSNEEKLKLKQIFKDNEEKYQTKLKEKYNIDNLFKNYNKMGITVDNNIENNVSMVEYKESIFRKFINKIRSIFK